MKAKFVALYVLSAAIFAGTLFAVIRVGADSGSAPLTAGRTLLKRLADGLHDPISLVLLQIVLIVAAARLVGSLFRKIGQPSVVGEMFAGIALGPSLLGAAAPSFSHFVFPSTGIENLSILSQFGILLFMFGVGMELDAKAFRGRAHSAIIVSHVSIFLPFALGSIASLWLFDSLGGQGTSFLAFALFMGISMSITAFPVLARILQERGMVRTAAGSTVLTSAAVDDVTAWCGLAIIVALARAHNPSGAISTLILTLLFVGLAFLGAKPAIERFAGREKEPSDPHPRALVVAILTAFAFAMITQTIGAHAFFGAFIAGVVMPKDPAFRRALHARFYSLSALILVPVFFAFTGLRTQLGLLRTATDWAVCGGIFLLAVVGKFGGSMIAARITGLSWRSSAGVGALMNTRGLVELIALNVGLDLGVLSPKMFSMLVLMALTTTFMTGPALALIKPDAEEQPELLASGYREPAPA